MKKGNGVTNRNLGVTRAFANNYSTKQKPQKIAFNSTKGNVQYLHRGWEFSCVLLILSNTDSLNSLSF